MRPCVKAGKYNMMPADQFIGENVRILRMRRKTIALRVLPDGGLELRIPSAMRQEDALRFLAEKREWIEKQRARISRCAAERASVVRLSAEELRVLGEQAVAAIPPRVAYYAPLVGVGYGRITIRCQRTRWGSCSSKGNLNFNCLLMLTPPEVLDSVVVHELCHRKEMNHSDRFYAEVLRVFPEYHRWDRWLREHGPALMARLPAKGE